MTEVETRILQNQIEILWVLNYALEKLAPDFVGRGGGLDLMRNDLADAAKESRAMLERR
jgi:hypothetical protein